MLMADFLRIHGYDVTTAHDGPSAMLALEHFDAEVAVLDIGLPGMSGNVLAEQIRATKGQPPRLIAMTGYAESKTSPAFERHLMKPVEPRRLVQAIESGPGDAT